MSIENWANYADIVSGIAVLVSLIYVGFQIHGNTRSSQSQTNMMTHESMANISMEIGKDAQLSALVRKGLLRFNDLSVDEQFQLLVILTSVFRRFENVFYQNKKGLLERELWKGYSHSMISYIQTDGGRAFWKLRKDSFSSSFSRYLENADSEELVIPHDE